MKLLVIAAALVAATAVHAESGMAFLKRCHGSKAPASCLTYERGFFDALKATNAICPTPGVDGMQIAIVSERWMKGHVNHLDVAAPLMLRNAMLHAWSCR